MACWYVRRVGGLSGRRYQSRPVAAIATRGLHVHGVAEGVPNIARVDTVIESPLGRAAIEVREYHFASEGPCVLRAEYCVEERVELPETHSAPGGEHTVDGVGNGRHDGSGERLSDREAIRDVPENRGHRHVKGVADGGE